jgi:Protein of unknown function (DUF3224)
MPTKASGSFDVTVVPQQPIEGSPLARMSINKQFHGDLTGTSVGEMLTTATESTGAAVYVALERVTATLGGRSGTFVLMHEGTMDRQAARLSVRVSPASGTGDLTGISGTLAINIVDKQHLYEFEYALPG